jgi:hypothetical protein
MVGRFLGISWRSCTLLGCMGDLIHDDTAYPLLFIGREKNFLPIVDICISLSKIRQVPQFASIRMDIPIVSAERTEEASALTSEFFSVFASFTPSFTPILRKGET